VRAVVCNRPELAGVDIREDRPSEGPRIFLKARCMAFALRVCQWDLSALRMPSDKISRSVLATLVRLTIASAVLR